MRALTALWRLARREPLVALTVLVILGYGAAWAVDGLRLKDADGVIQTICTDDVSGKHYYCFKLADGEDGSSTFADVLPDNSLKTTVGAALPAGGNTLGNVGINSALPAGDNNVGNVDIVSLPVATSAGTITALEGTVSITSSGAAAVAFQLTGTWTATVTFEGTVNGTDWVVADFWPGSGGSPQTTTTGNGVFLAATGGFQTVRARASAFTSGTISVSARTAPATGKMLASLAGGSGGTSSPFGSAFPANGTAMGLSDGANLQPGASADLDTRAGTRHGQIVNLVKRASGGPVEFGTSTDPVRTDPTGTTPQPVTGAVTSSGNVAHDSPVSGNPSQMAAEARSTSRAAVTEGDVDRLIASLEGALITRTAVPELSLQPPPATTTGTADTQVIAAQGAGSRVYVTSLMVSNTSGNNPLIDCKDGAGGTLLPVRQIAPAGSGFNMIFDPPLRMSDNTGFFCVSGTASTTVSFSANGYKGL